MFWFSGSGIRGLGLRKMEKIMDKKLENTPRSLFRV